MLIVCVVGGGELGGPGAGGGIQLFEPKNSPN